MKDVACFVVVACLLSLAFMAQQSKAQEKEVCLVYFTSNGCGDDCELTDTFMDGLMDEYTVNLTTITYYVDAGQENANIFGAYRANYNLPPEVPIVLFGEDDYLQGIDGIYENAEMKIFGFLQMNGTNCPLDSGYVPASRLGAGDLPGQPEVRIGGSAEEAGKPGAGGEGNNDDGFGDATGQNGGDILGVIFALDEPAKESLFSLAIVVAVLVVIALAVLFIWQKAQ